MSYSLDVNILLYASAATSPLHDRATSFLRECREGDDLLCLTWLTVMSYLRMVTHPGIISPPLAPVQATKNVDALLGLPQCRLLTEQEGFWDVYCDVTRDLAVRGKLVPDAHLAALLRQHGVGRLYSNDRDFRKFDFLDVRNPLE